MWRGVPWSVEESGLADLVVRAHGTYVPMPPRLTTLRLSQHGAPQRLTRPQALSPRERQAAEQVLAARRGITCLRVRGSCGLDGSAGTAGAARPPAGAAWSCVALTLLRHEGARLVMGRSHRNPQT